MFLSDKTDRPKLPWSNFPEEYMNQLVNSARGHLFLTADEKGNDFTVTNELSNSVSASPDNKGSLYISWEALPEKARVLVRKVFLTGAADSVLLAEPDLTGKEAVLEYDAVKVSPTQVLVYIRDFGIHQQIISDIYKGGEHLRRFQDHVPIGLFSLTAEGRLIYVNKWFANILGYETETELISMQLSRLFDNENQEKQFFKSLEDKHNRDEKEVLLKRRDNAVHWYGIRIQSASMQADGIELYEGYLYDISDRKIALEEINESREKYKTLYSFFRMMVDNVPDMIWAKDLHKKYIFTNKAMCDHLLMAKDTDEPIGKTDLFFAERERKKYLENPNWYTYGANCAESDEVILRTKKPHQFDEFGNVKGKFLYLDVNKAPLLNDEGKMIGIVGSARDVTVSKRIEDQREKEEKIKNLVYRIGNAVNTTKDISELLSVIRMELSQIIDTSNLFIALYNRTTDELSLPYFVDEKDRFKAIPSGKSLTSYMIRKKRPVLLREEELLELVDKGEIELMGTLAKVWLGIPLMFKGEIIGALVVQNYQNKDAFGDDDLDLLQFVSIQISISINQKMADDALRENEFTLRQIIDNVPVMIFAKDKNLRYLLANKALADACGKRVHEIEGNLQSEIHSTGSEVALYEKDDLEVLQSGNIKVIQEEPFTDKNGEVKILKSIKIPMKAGSESGIALIGVSIDITERITTEKELKSAKQKAEESDHLKTAFLANMSHEIRTPMNAIVGFSELLNDPDLPAKTREEFIDLIGINSNALLKLIEDIIDVAKIEANQIRIVKGACQVNQIMDDLEAYYRDQLEKTRCKKIVIQSKRAISDVYFAIETDPLRFKQIMNNLMGNAIKFTEKGSIEMGYFLEDESGIVFYVKDTGIGLAADKISLIFERFRQAEESSTKEYGGTGLGLTISRRLVEILGGAMWVDSALGEGSTFYFRLPFNSVEIHPKMQPFKAELHKHDWSGKTILVAEDEISNFELIRTVLEKTRAKVLRANNGKEAVEIVEKNIEIDLILMDIRMPVMDGYEATRIIKGIRSGIPVVSLTAYAMPDDREKSRLAGCDEHISKPFHPGKMLNKLELFVQKRKN
ncbi:MAG: PAS domain S-box protein [Bacteroidales bacterium]